jgi:hypothetical protein
MDILGTTETIYILSASDLEDAFRRIAAQVAAEREQELKGAKISRKAAAKRLGKDTSTLWRWDKSGYLKAHHQGASVFYWEADVRKIENGEL